MSADRHPTDAQLREYNLGKLDAPSSETVENHLTACDGCRERLTGISHDSFLKRMKDAVGGDRTSVQQPPPPDAGTAAWPIPPDATEELTLLASNGQYADIRPLGRGGMGVVYLARNVRLDRPEVLKVVGRHLLDREGTADRFVREMQAAARLAHPNIVAAYSAPEYGGLVVFAMEYVPGQDLSKLVKEKGPMKAPTACYYAYQVALGLQHAHERGGLVHRDIKPSNLMLVQEGKKRTVKILDFGLAKARNETATDKGARDHLTSASLTGANVMLGTPDYMAPEQSTDATSADIRADIYALGGTLHFLLTGRPPFAAGNLFDLLLQHRTAAPPRVDRVRPDVPPGLADVVARMLAKDPADRYQTPVEVASALVPFFKTVPKDGTDGGVSVVGPAPVVPAKPATAARKWWPYAAGLAGVLLAAYATAWLGVQVLVRTADGTLVVQTDESDVEVLVDGQVVTVRWADGQTAEAKVKPGSHRVQVRKGGVTAEGEEVTVTAGERKPVTIRLAQKPGPQRERVIRLLSSTAWLHGGEFTYEFTNDGRVRLRELNRTGKYTVEPNDRQVWFDWDEKRPDTFREGVKFDPELVAFEHSKSGYLVPLTLPDGPDTTLALSVRRKLCESKWRHFGGNEYEFTTAGRVTLTTQQRTGTYRIDRTTGHVYFAWDKPDKGINGEGLLYDRKSGAFTHLIGGAFTELKPAEVAKIPDVPPVVPKPDDVKLTPEKTKVDDTPAKLNPVETPAAPVWKPLFDGKTTAGLVAADGNEGRITVDGGTLIIRGGPDAGPGRHHAHALFRTARVDYRDARVRVVYRRPNQSAAYLALRTTKTEDVPQVNGRHFDGVVVSLGLENGKAPAGSVVVATPAVRKGQKGSLLARDVAQNRFNPPDTTGRVELVVELVGDRIRTLVNGQVVRELTDSTFATGGIGLFCNASGTLEVEAFEIIELKPPSQTFGYVPLFDGRSLAGWRMSAGNAGTWDVSKDGILVGRGGRRPPKSNKRDPHESALLETIRSDFRDVRLRIEYRRVPSSSFCMLAVRAGRTGHIDKHRSYFFDGCHIRLGGVTQYDNSYPPGGVLVRTGFGADDQEHPSEATSATQGNDWTVIEAQFIGDRIRTTVDGKPGVEVTSGRFQSGRIGLFCAAGGRIEVKSIDVQELSSGKP